jgi:hypothetical protein
VIKIEFSSLSYVQFDRRKVRSAMGKAARIVAKSLKASVGQRAGGGRVYLRNGRRYSASSPGAAPVRLTGALWRSVKGRPSKRGYAMFVSATAPHAHLMELGTRLSKPRPAFGPAFAMHLSQIQDLLRAAVGEGLTVAAGTPGQPPRETEVN